MTSSEILNCLPQFKGIALELRDVLLANIAMMGEILAPSGTEQDRVRFFLERLADSEVQCSTDENGSGIGVLMGEDAARNIVFATNADSLVRDDADQTIEIASDRIVGPFVGDNSVAMAALAVLPLALERMGIRLKSNLVLLAAARMLERSDHHGLRAFLDHFPGAVRAGVCVESVQLGRLNFRGLGLLKGEIVCRLPEDYDWAQYGTTGTITPMSEIIAQINRIAVPRDPKTSIVMGAIRGGISGHTIARQTNLLFEIRSESGELLEQIRQRVEDIVEDVGAASGMKARIEFYARRPPGGLEISHPLVRCARDVLNGLQVAPMMYPTIGYLSAFLSRKIPAVTIGCTTGERRGELDEIDEAIQVAPLFSGVAQMMALALLLDGGAADGG